MRLYFIRDHYLRPTEAGAVARQFVETLGDAQQVVRETEMASRPNISVLQLEVPTAKAELAETLTKIINGEIPLSIVLRSWQGTRRGGLADILDGEPEAKAPRARKVKEAAVTQRPVEDAGAFWARMNASRVGLKSKRGA